MKIEFNVRNTCLIMLNISRQTFVSRFIDKHEDCSQVYPNNGITHWTR